MAKTINITCNNYREKLRIGYTYDKKQYLIYTSIPFSKKIEKKIEIVLNKIKKDIIINEVSEKETYKNLFHFFYFKNFIQFNKDVFNNESKILNYLDFYFSKIGYDLFELDDNYLITEGIFTVELLSITTEEKLQEIITHIEEIYQVKPKKVEEKVKEKVKIDFLKLYVSWVEDIRKGSWQNANYFSIRALLKKWGKFEIEETDKKLMAQNWAATYYNRQKNHFNTFYAYLLKKGEIKVNPLADVGNIRASKLEDEKRVAMNFETINEILEAIRTDKYNSPLSRYTQSYSYPFFLFMARTGVRNEEAIGLQKKHVEIDLKAKTGIINIISVLSKDRSTGITRARIRKDTKTGNKRQIPFSFENNKDLYEMLIEQTKGKKSEDLVFLNFEKSNHIDDDNLSKRIWKPVCKKITGIEKDIYSLRHSFISNCIAKGIEINTIAYLCGNSAEIIYKNYSHLLNKPKTLPTF